MPPRKPSQSAITISDVPDGFVLGMGPDKKQYLVPDFMLPALELGFISRQYKEDLHVAGAQGGNGQVQSKPYDEIAEGYILFPADPPLSEQELLSAHANILALQQKYGISYKDAAHRQYMAQVERLKVSSTTYEDVKRVDDELDAILRSLGEGPVPVLDALKKDSV